MVVKSNSLFPGGAHSERALCLSSCSTVWPGRMCYFLFSPKRFSSRCSGEDGLGAVLREECCSNTKQPESQQPHTLTTSFPFATDPQLITLSHRSHSGLGPSAASSMNCGPLGKSVNVKVFGSFLFPSPEQVEALHRNDDNLRRTVFKISLQ